MLCAGYAFGWRQDVASAAADTGAAYSVAAQAPAHAGTGEATATSSQNVTLGRALAAADFDEDGVPDLVTGGPTNISGTGLLGAGITHIINSHNNVIGGTVPNARNVIAPVLFTLANGTVTNQTFAVTPAQVAQLKAGLLYFNVTTANNLNGELHGQILLNPLESARFFVRQQYLDFLSREPDTNGYDFWTCQITRSGPLQPDFCGPTPITDLTVIQQRRVAVSNAFFFELEYQQTGTYVYRLYRAAYGNTQPYPNPVGDNDTHPYCAANPNNCMALRAAYLPAYQQFAADRASLDASQLAATQLALAQRLAQRPEFAARYPLAQSAEQYVDALLTNIQIASNVNLSSQRTALLNLYNSAGGSVAGRGAVLFRLAEDNATGNPINNRALIDAEYNSSFVTTQYFGYLRRDADLPGLSFWLSVVNQYPLRSGAGQNGMVCAFITSAEYQQRFGIVASRSNTECQALLKAVNTNKPSI